MKEFKTINEVIGQLELPNYQTEDGFHKLSDNAAFVQLKGMLKSVPIDIIDDLEKMSNDYQVLNGCYVISKNVLDVYIQYLKYER